MIKKTFLVMLLIVQASVQLNAQNLKQTIKGKINDKESQSALVGANVYIEGSNPIIATTTDANGNFKLVGVPIGRQTVSVSYIGYNKISIPEVLVGSGKEVVMNIELKEEVSKLQEVVVTAKKSKGDVLNTMATVSSRSFNVEETQRYAGGFDDPARLASAFAGVSSTGSVESNAIIIRGNAPTGIMWQVEGVEVPVPSHFANADVLGGGSITLFSNQMLNNSDFYTGAFPSEYGNATAGVFDVRLRSGNPDKREYAIAVGAMGLDLSSEGPFSKEGKASYLFNYRYATLGLVKQFLPQSGLPVYQDLCFKINMPTNRAGTFTLWGIGGIDNYSNKAKTNRDEWTDDHARMNLDSWFYPGTTGAGHKIMIGSNAYAQTAVAASSYSNTDNSRWMNDELVSIPLYKSSYYEYKFTAKTMINYKFNAHITSRIGVIADMYSYNNASEKAYRIGNDDDFTPLQKIMDKSGTTHSFQFYTQHKFDINSNLSINAGLHTTYLALNKKSSVEPRAGIKYNLNKRHAIGFAFGMHSQMQLINMYFITKQVNGETTMQNKNLDFTKAQHFVLSYDYNINENMRLKIEPYYQKLMSIPVEDNTSFALINIQETHGFDKVLESKGTGRNYGIDFTLERFLNNGFYYLATASLYDSKYKGGDGIERNTLYNNNYILNLLGGKEWSIGRSSKNNLLGINGRLFLRGGDRKNPVDNANSILRREVVYLQSEAFSKQNPLLYRFDITVSYRINRSGVSHILSLQMNNVLSSPTVYDDIYDYKINDVRENVEGSVFPSASWKVEF
jgi:hypothetical protein